MEISMIVDYDNLFGKQSNVKHGGEFTMTSCRCFYWKISPNYLNSFSIVHNCVWTADLYPFIFKCVFGQHGASFRSPGHDASCHRKDNYPFVFDTIALLSGDDLRKQENLSLPVRRRFTCQVYEDTNYHLEAMPINPLGNCKIFHAASWFSSLSGDFLYVPALSCRAQSESFV